MKRLISLLLLAFALIACQPVIDYEQAPDGLVTLKSYEIAGVTTFSLETTQKLTRAILVVSGENLAVNTEGCTVDADGAVVCVFKDVASGFTVPVSGAVEFADGVVCLPDECFNIRWL